jgi:hypothetical protein
VTAEIMTDKPFQAELEALSIDPIADSTPESTRQLIRVELAKCASIIKATGVKLE